MRKAFKLKIDRLKETARHVIHDQPGKRFTNYHKRKQKKFEEHPVKKALHYSIGFILIVAGFLLGFVPGAPGFFLGVPGLALVAARSKTLARLIDKGELAIRKLWKKLSG